MRLVYVARFVGMGASGEERDVNAFCHRLYPRLVGALGLHCGDVGIAEELAQETLARVWERWDTVRYSRSPDAWAFRVAYNLANSRFRRSSAEQRAYGRVGPTRDAATAIDTAGKVAVRRAVLALPPRQRMVIVLRYFADLSVEDTASAMSCAQGTVKSLTSRAIDALRAQLGDPFEEALDA